MLGWGPRYIIDKIPSPVLRYHVGPSIRCISAATRVSRAAVAKQTSKKTKYEALPPDWQAVIGVEVHAQLKSRKKLFSSASSDEVEIQSSVDSENSLVAPFDVALPGSLPSLQKEPLQLALRACLALECEIADTMSFDRKHYFYPDLTSGYQITQKYGEFGHTTLELARKEVV
jgi:aspartyl-tRNA(Asn)/glutamyl-tRNA(Gln) amidotransferase subunit B